MDTWYMRYGVIVVCGIVSVGWYQYLNCSKLTPSEWAAWVQALGSIVAIFAAVWVSHDQHKKAVDREAKQERAEVSSMLQSLHDEIKVMADGFKLSAGDSIARTQEGPVSFRFYLSDRPFQMYKAHIGHLGKIPDHDLRRAIISAYTRFQIFLLSLEMNNDYFAEYEVARKRAAVDRTAFNHDELVAAQDKHAKHGDVLRKGYTDCEKCVDEILAVLLRAIKSHH